MTVGKLIEAGVFQLLNQGDNLEQRITRPFCCDLLSSCMTKIPAGAAWVTVIGNINTLAVLTLTDAACVILAEGAFLDEAAARKAKEQGITVFATDLPIFEAALRVYELEHV
ncbi:hypothetical protein [Acetivibrio ethanolgignens]|uniref:DRTGG domain-containing protein n=1 Tax=Acetivibrio ethanolgignens TaxID=290052 RepID=A0A0V8QC28_9FIRM|nr:hypothetical protein [Acetivibrio ethanolgignens]KSV58044.1 hypothetical protein ASU35_03135 [Acetivibrio ethanolgignens]